SSSACPGVDAKHSSETVSDDRTAPHGDLGAGASRSAANRSPAGVSRKVHSSYTLPFMTRRQRFTTKLRTRPRSRRSTACLLVFASPTTTSTPSRSPPALTGHPHRCAPSSLGVNPWTGAGLLLESGLPLPDSRSPLPSLVSPFSPATTGGAIPVPLLASPPACPSSTIGEGEIFSN